MRAIARELRARVVPLRSQLDARAQLELDMALALSRIEPAMPGALENA